MKFLNQDDNKYRVRFMKHTEMLIDKLTVKEFISYLESDAVLEDETYKYIDNKVIKCKIYNLQEVASNLHKEFLITEDNRFFYCPSMLQVIELVDGDSEAKEIDTLKDIKQKRKILNMHGIPYFEKNNNIYADTMEAGTKKFEKCANVTEWSIKKLYEWLGY